MSDKEHPEHHGATTIHATKGGGGGKWLLGAAAAAVILGGGYYAYTNYAPNQDRTEIAYNEPYGEDPLRAGPLEPADDLSAESASVDDVAPPADTQTEQGTERTQRRSTARTQPVPEETIGITQASYTGSESDEIVVPGARRPVWERTPTARRLAALYPQRALDRGREGQARLACVVGDAGRLDCESVEATPGGFSNAALRVARTYRHAPTLADGSSAAGTPVNLRVVFKIEDEETRRG